VNKVTSPKGEAAEPMGTTAPASTPAVQSLIIRQGRGRLGGSTLLEYLVLRARRAGRSVIVGDGDVDHASLSQVFPPGTVEGAVPPLSAQPADLKQWVTDLIGRAVDERSSLVLDLGGGEAILRDYNEDTSLVEFCDEVGMESVGLFMCGAEPADFDHVVGIWDSGHFRPRRPVLVFNEFLAPPGRSALGAFDFLMKRPEFDRLMAEGMRCLTIPRLVPMPALRNAGLSFHEGMQGKAGRSGKPLGPMERHQLRKWVERLEEGLSALKAENWLP
jgi:hypothetical protein